MAINYQARAQNLISHNKNVTATAKTLGINQTTLSRIAYGESKNPNKKTKDAINKEYNRLNPKTSENRKLEDKFGRSGTEQTNREKAELAVKYNKRAKINYSVVVTQEVEESIGGVGQGTQTIYGRGDTVEEAEDNLAQTIKDLEPGGVSAQFAKGEYYPVSDPKYRVYPKRTREEAQQNPSTMVSNKKAWREANA